MRKCIVEPEVGLSVVNESLVVGGQIGTLYAATVVLIAAELEFARDGRGVDSEDNGPDSTAVGSVVAVETVVAVVVLERVNSGRGTLSSTAVAAAVAAVAIADAAYIAGLPPAIVVAAFVPPTSAVFPSPIVSAAVSPVQSVPAPIEFAASVVA